MWHIHVTLAWDPLDTQAGLKIAHGAQLTKHATSIVASVLLMARMLYRRTHNPEVVDTIIVSNKAAMLRALQAARAGRQADA